MPKTSEGNYKWAKCKVCHGAGLISHNNTEYIATCSKCGGLGVTRRRRKKKIVPPDPIIPSGIPPDDQDLIDYLDGIS